MVQRGRLVRHARNRCAEPALPISPSPANMPTGMAAALASKIVIYRHSHPAALAMRVGLATKAVGVGQCALPGTQ